VELTIAGFSVKVAIPKSNGRMNRVFHRQKPLTESHYRVGEGIWRFDVSSGRNAAVTSDSSVQRVLFSFHIVEIS
jgi:hypothetical protein